MQAIDNLDKNIQLIFSWLRGNPDIKLLYFQRQGLIFIINKVVCGDKLTRDDWDRIKLPFYKIDISSSINDFSKFINEMAIGLIDNPNVEISKEKKRLLVLLDLINKRAVMTDGEEQEMVYKLQGKEGDALKRKLEEIKKLQLQSNSSSGKNKEMSPYQLRLLAEEKEIQDELEKLNVKIKELVDKLKPVYDRIGLKINKDGKIIFK